MAELESYYYYEDRVITPATHLYRVYHADEADKVIAELKAQVNGFQNRANLWEYNAQNEHNAVVAVRMENAKLEAKVDKLFSGLKCLVMRDLIKDCPEKKSVIELVKEWK